MPLGLSTRSSMASSEPAAEHHSSHRRSRSERVEGANASSHSSSSSSAPSTYGYHNTFHTHAQILHVDSKPPTYACATSQQTMDRLHAKAEAEKAALDDAPPEYSCSVEISGVLGLKHELSTPFQVAGNREWTEVYAVLRGTQLSFYRAKTSHFFSKTRGAAVAGRLIKTFTLQHAEVGIASDFRKTALIPSSPFAHLVPASSRQKLYETDPHLFEPVREHVLRLRAETEQILLCCKSQESLLDWVEALGAAVDISPPLEDRSEPRYRSLPRRSRRQRMLDGPRLADNLENLNNVEGGRRIIAEQERIIRQLYPHLAAATTTTCTGGQTTEPQEFIQEIEHVAPAAEGDNDEYDAADVRFPSAGRPGSSSTPSRTVSRDGDADARPPTNASSSDPKHATPLRHSSSQALRYRRRCAPVLLASSPRVSDVVFTNGTRMRICVKQHTLIDYISQPPRYDAHKFPKKKPKHLPLAKVTEETTAATTKPASHAAAERPSSPVRAVSAESLDSTASSLDAEAFGFDLGSSSSDQTSEAAADSDEIRSIPPFSEPPSPTQVSQAKADVARQLARLGKTRSSEEDRDVNSVALGAGLLV